MITSEDTNKAADFLKEAAKLLKPDQAYTMIELLAAFYRGIDTITDPVLKKEK